MLSNQSFKPVHVKFLMTHKNGLMVKIITKKSHLKVTGGF